MPVRSDFSQLPFQENHVDMAIFNASFHYATSYEDTLREALHVLHPKGLVVILDTPIYHLPSSGSRMIRERETFFQRKNGFPSNTMPMENFLTYSRLEDLSNHLGIGWQLIQPNFGIKWHIRRFLSRLRTRRETASFPLLIGHIISN